MTFDRVAIVERVLDDYLAGAADAGQALEPDAPIREGSGLTARKAIELFEDQVTSRAIDVAGRELKKTDRSFYTISSAGHENNAVLGATLRITDPAFLHYRSGALMMARARQLPGMTPAFDALLGIVASSDEPIAQGRHKVWGSRPLWVPPQTSTIASHLPKAMGLAFSLARARRLGVDGELPADAVVLCSFGDASANHATALAAINTARYAARIGLPMPILFVCEDNGTGISVPTPDDWIRETFSAQPHLRYVLAAGELDEVWDATAEAVHYVRSSRQPAFLHLPVVRLWGHAGSDAEHAYRSAAQIAANEAGDPLLRNARRLIETGAISASALRDLVEETRGRVMAAAEEAARRPRLDTTEAVVGPMAPYHPSRVAERATRPLLTDDERREAVADPLPETATNPNARTLAGNLNAALADELARRPELVLFGEDVGRKGGVYNVTNGLQQRFGAGRVFDTLLDETSILGIAQGAAHIGLLPVPEIQYLAYIHNALDQIRGEAASLQFFSSGPVPQSHGRAPARARLPEGLRRPLPQRQQRRRAARHPRTGRRRPGTRRRRGPHAARRDRHGHRGRAGGGLHRADRALPREGPARTRRRRLADRLPGTALPPAAGRAGALRDRWGRWIGPARSADRLLRQRPAPVAAGRSVAWPRSTGSAHECSTCAGSTRCRPMRCGTRRPRQARCWWSTSAAAPVAAWPTRSSPTSSSPGQPRRAAWHRSGRSTASSRSARRPPRYWSAWTRC